MKVSCIYCLATCAGIPEQLWCQVCMPLQDTIARVIKLSRSNTGVMDILKDLHWLPIRYRIDFKIATLAYKVRSSSPPVYLLSLISDYAPIRSCIQLGLTFCTFLVLRQLLVRVHFRRRRQKFGSVYQLTSEYHTIDFSP